MYIDITDGVDFTDTFKHKGTGFNLFLVSLIDYDQICEINSISDIDIHL